MKNTKVIIAGVALVAALGIYFFVGSGVEAVPDTDDTRTTWICLACEKPFTLTAAEFEDASRSSGKAYLVVCPACSELKGVRSAQCAACQNQFALTNAEGEDTTCKKCQPATVNAQRQAAPETPEEIVAPAEEEAQSEKPITFVQ